jgi:membrane-associated phospholipid phosphatase
LGGLVLPWTAMAGPLGHDAAEFASGTGDILFLTVGTALPLLTDGDQGKDHALRALDALIISTFLSEGFKALIPEERPDGSDDKSFPSGHATAAVAVATAESVWHPKQAPLWYLGAVIIADSRLELNKHRAIDVLAGAALGYFTAQLELSQPHGILLSPLIESNGGCIGVKVTAVF